METNISDVGIALIINSHAMGHKEHVFSKAFNRFTSFGIESYDDIFANQSWCRQFVVAAKSARNDIFVLFVFYSCPF